MRAIIADDEPLARQLIRTFSRDEPDLEVVAECADGMETIRAIETLRPDLVFLDVQMPLADGFDVIDAVGADRMPATLFVTAYDEFAVRAFEANAVDYLLKPVTRERFQTGVQRIRKMAGDRRGDLARELAELLAKNGKYATDRIVVRSGGKYVFLEVEQIDRIESEQNYLTLHTGGKKYLHRSTMNTIEQRLPRDLFVRIHRSTMVNIRRITAIQPYSGNEYLVFLSDGTEILSSRTYRERIRQLLRS